jgi:manganese/zinc/iron transport system permease protein
MAGFEDLLVQGILNLVAREDLNAFLREPRNTATIVGVFIAVSGGILGAFLLLRGMALTSDAISHTVLLGIVVAFIVMTRGFGAPPDLASPWLIIGAAAAGVATVVLTEVIYRSGLLRQDAALGLAFPLLFAVAVILIAGAVEDAHMDEDAVMVGEIGVAWADTNSHCIDNCRRVTITPDDPRAQIARQCTNCRSEGISPRDPGAEFEEICSNCGRYSPAQAWQAGLLEEKPLLVHWPKSITVTFVMAVLTFIFALVFFKEMKLSTFDAALAQALGFRPGLLHYCLMILVSLVAVGAFNAVGSILVIAFFIIPPAAAYLLTDRLPLMLLLSAVIGAAGAYFGYPVARGELFGLTIIEGLNTSISASMVIMMFLLFIASWLLSPRYGLISSTLRHARNRRRFTDLVLLGHIYNHEGTDEADVELHLDTLHRHVQWEEASLRGTIARLRRNGDLRVASGMLELTPQGRRRIETFRRSMS